MGAVKQNLEQQNTLVVKIGKLLNNYMSHYPKNYPPLSFDKIKHSRQAGGLTYKHTVVDINTHTGTVVYGLTTKVDEINVTLFYEWTQATVDVDSAPNKKDITYTKCQVRDLQDKVNRNEIEIEGDVRTSKELSTFIKARSSSKHSLNFSADDIEHAVDDGYNKIIEWFGNNPHMESFEFEKLFAKILNS